MVKINKTIKQKTRIISCILGLSLCVTLCPPAAVMASETSTDGLDRIITRTDRSDDRNMIHSSMEDASGQTYTDPGADDTGRSLKKAADLPARYDLRDYNLTTSIKDQGVTNICWAFSVIKTIESNCIKNGLFSPETADFSENHLAWFSYHPSTDISDPTCRDGISSAANTSDASFLPNPFAYGSVSGTIPYDNGGSALLANFTLAKWSGAELESAAPFTGDTIENETAMAYNMVQNGKLRYDSYAHLQNVYNFDEYLIGRNYYYDNPSMIPEMKQAILDYGAMSVSLFYDRSFLHQSANGYAYYQNYYAGSKAVKNANHSVTIIGWDDNFSASNFSRTPSGNGAWLIANSYGTSSGDNGYFWLSYYDPSICDCSSFLMESPANYNNIYQYDGFGWGTVTYSDDASLKVANVFQANADSNQKLRAVSFYTMTNDQSYRIQVYRGVKSGPTDGVLIDTCTTTGTATRNGYHTVSLAAPVNLEAGEQFSVVVTYIQDGSDTVYAPMEGKDTTDSSLNISYSSETGQSYIYTKKKTTAANSTIHWMDTSALGYNNVCVKAFADNTTETADALPSVKKTITLGKGETYRLPDHYTGYTSNDPALASVSGTGKVSALKRGKTSILVSNETETVLYRFNIKKAPSKVKFKPSTKKKTIKKGKHFTLKVKLSSGSASHKLRFHSSHPGVAKVSLTGKVTARRRGSSTISVKTYNGHKAKLKLTVVK
ncbi:lectin like domain-containing protein [Jutongia sp.]|uniref:lectin like domain-containing protein n=1 Tax=Jutongia sp. TaxID=2944204 RepID=UPI0030806761